MELAEPPQPAPAGVSDRSEGLPAPPGTPDVESRDLCCGMLEAAQLLTAGTSTRHGTLQSPVTGTDQLWSFIKQ